MRVHPESMRFVRIEIGRAVLFMLDIAHQQRLVKIGVTRRKSVLVGEIAGIEFVYINQPRMKARGQLARDHFEVNAKVDEPYAVE